MPTGLYRNEGLSRKELWLRLRKLQFPPYYRPSALGLISKAFCCHNWGPWQLFSTYIRSWVICWRPKPFPTPNSHPHRPAPGWGWGWWLLETKRGKREKQRNKKGGECVFAFYLGCDITCSQVSVGLGLWEGMPSCPGNRCHLGVTFQRFELICQTGSWYQQRISKYAFT